jgi:hypothetical protein
MRRVFNILNLRIDRKTYYNLVRNKLLKDGILNNLFKTLVFVLKEVGFRFIYDINNELIKNNSVKRRVFK